MTNKETTLKALNDAIGDDLYRAKRAFKGCSLEQMNEPYGESGRTRAELIAEYEAHEAKIKAAITWVQQCS